MWGRVAFALHPAPCRCVTCEQRKWLVEEAFALWPFPRAQPPCSRSTAGVGIGVERWEAGFGDDTGAGADGPRKQAPAAYLRLALPERMITYTPVRSNAPMMICTLVIRSPNSSADMVPVISGIVSEKLEHTATPRRLTATK